MSTLNIDQLLSEAESEFERLYGVPAPANLTAPIPTDARSRSLDAEAMETLKKKIRAKIAEKKRATKK